MRPLLVLSVALLGCSPHAGQSDVDAAPSCLGHAAVGTWAAIANDGTLVDAAPRFTFASDCTFSTDAQHGTWQGAANGHELTIMSNAASVQDAYVSGDRMLIGVDGKLTSGGLPRDPSGTMWQWSFGACCANGSPYSLAWDLSLDPSGSFVEHWIPSTAMGPSAETCAGTWLTKPLGFDLTVTSGPCAPAGFVWLDSYLGPGYQRQ